MKKILMAASVAFAGLVSATPAHAYCSYYYGVLQGGDPSCPRIQPGYSGPLPGQEYPGGYYNNGYNGYAQNPVVLTWRNRKPKDGEPITNPDCSVMHWDKKARKMILDREAPIGGCPRSTVLTRDYMSRQ